MNGLVNAWKILKNNAAGAQIHVANFRIPHLPFGKADIVFRCLKKGVRIRLPSLIPKGGACSKNRIVFRLLAMSPAIQYAQ